MAYASARTWPDAQLVERRLLHRRRDRMFDRVTDHTQPQAVRFGIDYVAREGIAAGRRRISFAIDKIDVLLLLVGVVAKR